MTAGAAGWLVAVAGAFAVAACSADKPPDSPSDDDVTTIQSAVNTTVVVTVTDTSGAVQVGRIVQAQKKSTGAFIQSNTTNSQGRATFSLANGQYRFATAGSPAGYYFYSGTPGSCTTPACTSTSITVTATVAVTLIDGWGNPVADQAIDAIDANGGVENTGPTDTQGHLSLSVRSGTYHFRAIYGNAYFLSAACAVPGCVSATVQIEKPVQVTVTDGYGAARADETVLGVDCDNNQVNAETTDSTGHASLYLPPGSFTIRVIDGNMYFDSATCVIPGCTNVALAVTDVVVTVTDADGHPVPDLTVKAVDDSDGSEINWIDTDAQGHADVFVPAGAYKFRVVVDGNYIESGPDGHCQVTGCRTASITIPAPVVVTVVNASNQPIANQQVTAEPQGCGVPPATMTTDAQGHASFTLSPGAWRFTASCGCEVFYSGPPGSCVVPGCVSAQITMICGACAGKPNGFACNDGNACTQTDTCQSGACVGSNPVTCSAQDQCHVAGTCNMQTGVCSNPAKANGTSCSDGNACTGPDTCQSGNCTPGGSTCASITVEHNMSTTLQPTLAATLAADDLSVVPGDPVAFTSLVTNTGTVFNLGADFRITNPGSMAFVVGGFQQTLEYQAVPSGVWTPFARLVYDGAGNVVPETTLLQLQFSLVVPLSDGSGATYPPSPPNQNQATGTSIAPGGNGHWVHIGPVLQIPADVVAIIFDPAQSAGLRAVLRVDVPSAPAVSAVNALEYPGTTGNITDVNAVVHLSIASQPDQPSPLSSSESGPLTPGATRVFTGTIAMPTVTPFPLFAGESEATYVNRMFGAQAGYLPFVQAVGNAPTGVQGATAFVRIDAEIPFLFGEVKTGPAAINAGLTGTYSVTLPNIGHAPALALTLTDTVDGDLVTMGDLSLPASVGASPANAVASFKLAAPLGRPASPSTDVATVTWKDRNDNPYGPITASFTGNVNAGHPEGYLSLKADTGITDVVGVDKPFVVTALDPFGNPAPGVVVHFVVTGVNPQTPDVTTGADGKATFTYAGPTMGNDTVVVSATVTTTQITLDPVHVQWGTATGTPCTGRATPLDILLVVDVSGSMALPLSEGKLPAAQAAGDRFIDNLTTPRDQIGIITFMAGPSLTPLSTDKANAKTHLDDGIAGGILCTGLLCPGGSDVALALNAALNELESPRHRPEAMKVIVYVGDGGADHDTAAAFARLRASGARVVAIGIGSDIDRAIVTQIADSANDFFYAPSGTGVDFAFNNLNQDLCRNLAPIVSAGGDQGAYGVRLPDVLTLQGEVHDDGPDGDVRLTSTWTVISGPGPVAFVDASRPVTKALFTDPGTYVLQLAATDGYLTVADRATITVDPEPNLTGASLVVALGTPSPMTTGTLETITATLRDASATPIGNFPVNLIIAGANPAQATAISNAAGVATFTHTGTRAGTDQIHATAFAPTFQIDSAVVPLTWNDPPIGGPLLTQGWIASPAHQSTIMDRVPVVLSNDVTLTSGTLTFWPDAHPDQVHTLATGLTGSPGATLATFDPTVLSNGSYIIALDGVDDTNHQRQSEVLVVVSGEYKPGRVVVEVTDLKIPIAGLPITVGRRYDSLEKDNVGDFGHGWSLMIGHPKLEVDQAHGVAITMPNGRRANFRFAPSYPVVGPAIIGFLLFPAYQPEPGIYGTLTANGCPVLMLHPFTADPPVCFAALDPSELPYAPTEYTYTDPDGRAYVMGATGELRSIKDRQGNTLTFQPNGIISNAGKTVSFDRDPATGRIRKIDYPAYFGDVDVGRYSYDAAGDLVTIDLALVPNAFFRVLHHTYDGAHRLKTSIDANGHTMRTSTYDTDGRLATDDSSR